MNSSHNGADAHRHLWRTSSRHLTSEGVVGYQRCRCGRFRVLLGEQAVIATDGLA